MSPVIPSPTPPPSVAGCVLRHYGWVLVMLLPLHGAAWWLLQHKDRRANPAGSPAQKTAYFCEHADQFDLLFIGDSRAYCGLHPHEIDPLLGARSLNLASFAHWLPTQYPAYQALLPCVRPGTTVVWSIGVGNLHPRGNEKIQNSYPVGLANVPRYLSWGYTWRELEPNLLYFATHDWPGRTLAAVRSIQQRPVLRLAMERDSADPQTLELQRLLDSAAADPSIATVEVVRAAESDAVTSLAMITNRGAYLRQEITPEYFRAQQQTLARQLREQPITADPVTANPAYWSTFLGILDLFEQHDVVLLVNEIPEAPFVYQNSLHDRADRDFLRSEVRAAVEQRGFVWVAADTRDLRDEDFFDRNHLNSQGIVRYARAMAAALQPHLQRGGPAFQRSQRFRP